jgi:hypothetical protein
LKGPAEHSRRRLELRILRLTVLLLGAIFGVFPRATAATLPDKASASAILDHFRQSIWAEPVYAEFNLIQMPRRGDERVSRGRFWGARSDRGPVTRIELDVGKGGFTRHVLLQGGADGGIWTSDGPGAGAPAEAALLSPLVPGVEMTPFDILPMPYLYWLDYELVATQRIRGRPAYMFVFSPSADFQVQFPAVKSVRAYLDTQYDALVQSEAIGQAGNLSKTLSLLELRKVGDRWIPKDIDVRNEATRDKTRLTLTAVSVGAMPDPSVFDPAQLGAPAALPPASGIVRVSP